MEEQIVGQALNVKLWERGRDILMWPYHLWGYTGRRLIRFGLLLGGVFTGFFGFMAHVWFVRGDEAADFWQKQWAGLRGWLHQFIVGAFDLVGGPEIIQGVMRWGLWPDTRPLNEPELEAVISVLGADALPYDQVRIAQGGLLKHIFKLNKHRAFATWHTIYLPNRPEGTIRALGLMVHEMTHIYQYELLGTRYIGEALYVQAKMGGACYDYGGPAGLIEACASGRPYHSFNREQQAQIAEHFYILGAEGKDQGPYHPYIEQLREGKF